jgi:hypothetical protein
MVHVDHHHSHYRRTAAAGPEGVNSGVEGSPGGLSPVKVSADDAPA